MYVPLALKVKEVRNDTPQLRTYIFERKLSAKPGQFVMVWLPGVDEVPMSVGWQSETEFHLGIANAGDCTGAIFDQIKAGDKLGIRGPLGSSFSIPKDAKSIVVIGGGYGTPPMLSLAQEARAKKIEVIAILGARSKDYLIYEEWFKKIGCEVKVSTDDGSKGHKGYNTDLLEDLLKKTAGKSKPDAIYTCGPEKMMVKVAKIAEDHNIFCEASLERYMKCGFGACGQCCMDGTGIRICKEGPVIKGTDALKLEEFGKYTRDSAGTIKNL